MQRLAFSLSLVVDQSNVNKISIITEPKVEGTPIAQMIGMLAHVRGDLADGTYTLAYSSENGLRVDGPHERSANAIKGLLADDVAVLHGRFVEEGRDLPSDDELVERIASVVADAVLASGRAARFKPGSLELHFETGAGFDAYEDAYRLHSLRFDQEKDTDQASRARRATEIADLEGRNLPQVKDFCYIATTAQTSAFTGWKSAYLARKHEELTPRVEIRVAEILYERLARLVAEYSSDHNAIETAFHLHH